ncbi:hypothetical protein D9M70_478450 [compost metagenome]
MRRGGDLGNVAQQGYVLWTAIEFVVGNDCRDGLSAGRVVFLGIGVHVQAALGDFRRVLEVLNQVFLADVQQLDAHVLAEVSLVDQRLHALPGGLHALEIGMVHHHIKLATDLVVELGDVLIQQDLVQALDFSRRLLQQV